jgi:hypothetical protein
LTTLATTSYATLYSTAIASSSATVVLCSYLAYAFFLVASFTYTYYLVAPTTASYFSLVLASLVFLFFFVAFSFSKLFPVLSSSYMPLFIPPWLTQNA